MFWYLLFSLVCLTAAALLLSVSKRRTASCAAPAFAPEEFTSTMVHDLRSPISNTLTALTMLRDDQHNQLSADGQLLLDMTLTNTEKTLKLVNQILEFNRLEQGGLSLQQTAVSLPNLIQSVFQSQQPLATSQRVLLKASLPPDLPTVWVDALLLERVLQNLVDNAIQASPTGGKVTVSAVLRKKQLVVTVADEGEGVPAGLETAVFDKFSSGRANGTGLGLAFCQMVLDAHQQTIWYEKNDAGGATFSFTLPLTSQPTPKRQLMLNFL